MLLQMVVELVVLSLSLMLSLLIVIPSSAKPAAKAAVIALLIGVYGVYGGGELVVMGVVVIVVSVEPAVGVTPDVSLLPLPSVSFAIAESLVISVLTSTITSLKISYIPIVNWGAWSVWWW